MLSDKTAGAIVAAILSRRPFSSIRFATNSKNPVELGFETVPDFLSIEAFSLARMLFARTADSLLTNYARASSKVAALSFLKRLTSCLESSSSK